MLDAIKISVVGDIDAKHLFPSLDNHMFDTAHNDNHVITLIKIICQSYCKIRFHHMAKEFTTRISGEKIRKKMNKLVLFKNQ